MRYPEIISEEATLALMNAGASISRFGDGEWRCAAGGGCTSQRADPALARELQQVLKEAGDQFLVGIPNPFHAGAPRTESWIKYTQPPYSDLLRKGPYASSFITRPDNAPWIDAPEFWAGVRQLWKGREVVLVVGQARDGNGPEKKSLTREMLSDAASVQVVVGPRQHAYESIDTLEAAAAHQAAGGKPVLLCLGTTATVLAWRLWRRGIHALDLGHIGMFMRHAGAYRYAADDLVSPQYRHQIQALHDSARWGADGGKHTAAVRALVAEYQPETILDYGCGENRLAESLKPDIRVQGYDPGIPERAKLPKPCDLVVCTDVIEHVEPEKLDAVLDHIYRITGAVAYLVISCKPANAVLPDGRNAHLSVHPADFWLDKLARQGWAVLDSKIAKDLTVTLRKPP